MASYKVMEVATFGNQTAGFNLGDTIELKQLFKLKELFGLEAKNKYTAKSLPDGKEFFVAETGPDKCHRVCCEANREWNLSVYDGPDNQYPEVLRMQKNQECCISCCGHEPTPCCADRVLTVTAPDGRKLATAEQSCCICCSYDIEVTVRDETRYHITGSHCQTGMCCPCFDDAEFEITDADGEPTAGSVVRPQMTVSEVCGKTNRISIEFPENIGQEDKIGLLGGAMMFDILEEIRQKNRDNQNSGAGS